MIAGLILAGGRSSRMGGRDKALLTVKGRRLIDQVVARAAPQVEPLLISANGDLGRFADLGLPVLPDSVPGQVGPLAGILTGLEWLQAHRPEIGWMATFAVDTPGFPGDLVSRLKTAVDERQADLACARSDNRIHGVFLLCPVRLAQPLRRALTGEDLRSVKWWLASHKVAEVEWPGTGRDDPFLNVNTPTDLAGLDQG